MLPTWITEPWTVAIGAVACAAAGRRLPAGAARSAVLAVVHVSAAGHLIGRELPEIFFGYVGLVIAHYALVRALAARPDAYAWIAFAFPLSWLVAARAMPGIAAPAGMSFMAFRLSQLVLDVRNGAAPLPGLAEYLGFAFFAPTLAVGPISPYGVHQRSLALPAAEVAPPSLALYRILVGATKFVVLGSMFDQLSYRGLLLDGRAHGVLDLPVAAVAYYLYLYCNFSGFCDLAIGAAALIGVRVRENFDSPLIARNPADFWNRWHITLSVYLREVLFTPLSKALVSRAGPAAAPHAIAVSILAVFVTVGAWHGAGLHYLAFGAWHGAGVVAHHYYVLALKRRLGREAYRAYGESRAAHALAVCGTFCFVTAGFFLFANDGESARKVLHAITG